MKDYVLAEFYIDSETEAQIRAELKKLGTDFIPLASTEMHNEFDIASAAGGWAIISGNMNSQVAAMIKMGSVPVLAEAMHVSMIPESLKDKYRKK